MIFDTHAHYDDEAYTEDREALFAQMRQEGVAWITNIGASMESVKKGLEIVKSHDFMYMAAGVHPSECGTMTMEDIGWLRLLAAEEKKVVAIGEIGLDYHYEEPEKEVQKKWFIEQLRLAKQQQLPVCIHSRDAAQDTLDIMKKEHAEDIGGVIHCFSYGTEMAQIYLDMGFYLGIGGVVTFKNAKKLKQVVTMVPIERIVLETDAPYLTPEPYRGQRNASHYLKYVVQQIAELKGMDTKDVISITTENAKKLYRIKE